MTLLPGFGIFERGASLYPGGSSIAYARALGCDSLALLVDVASPAHLAEARSSGLRCWLYDGPGREGEPGGWQPGTWRATARRIEELVRAFPFIVGCIVDMEGGWQSVASSEADALFAWMNGRIRAGWSVGWTSYPAHRFLQRAARTCPGAFGVPQVYGIESPGTPAQLRARAEVWRPLFGAGMVPALAAWNRTAPEERAYLEAFEPGRGLFWHTRAPVGDVAAVIKTWAARRPSWTPAIIGGILLGCAAAWKLYPF